MADLSEEELAAAQKHMEECGLGGGNTTWLYYDLRLMLAEIRRLRAALAERDELLGRVGGHMRTLLKWCPAQRGEWMDQDSYERFKELRDEAVLFAAAPQEPQP